MDRGQRELESARRPAARQGEAPHVVAIDYGVKLNILRSLVDVGARVTVVPSTTSAQDVLALKPDGVFLSNGPGDPAAVDHAIGTIRELLGKKPMFGICLGHQLLGLAVGASTYKLKFGHRGLNQPVKELTSGKIEITTQNHGFAVRGEAGQRLQTDFGEAELTHVNLYDGTIEGLRLLDVPAGCVQYHPEAGPGPHDSVGLFDEFIGGNSKFRAA